MGKTTLMRLLQGELTYDGIISSPLTFDYFPYPLPEEKIALEAIREVIADFASMEAEMAYTAALAGRDEAALQRFGEVQLRYQEHDGYIIDELIAAEVGRLKVAVEVLQRPVSSLSGGERTKLMLAALFLKKDNFLLIDEPTDHLDREGRRVVADYL
ncbi:MAG: ATP-binding cassette domain-containing protein, partial [Symbiobacteriaceae bacterium]|nr:ATP-binding cassette domain-containing protein [Symbiobacteriaceae bacterium]